MPVKYRVVATEIPGNAPYLTPDISQEQAWALKALLSGTASPAEQGLAVRFILHTLAGVDQLEYRPNDRDHAFASGRRFVGWCIVRFASMQPDEITTLPKLRTSPGGLEDDEMPNT